MKLTALFLMLLTTSGAFAQSDTQSVPERYLPFQGEWRVVSMNGSKTKSSDPPEIIVEVTGLKFRLSGSGVPESLQHVPPDALEFKIPETDSDRPYRVLRDRGATALDDIVDVKNQITVFWYVGIFDLTDDKLQLALKYCGQGVEGVHFKNFRPPSSFDKKPIDGEIRISLERKQK